MSIDFQDFLRQKTAGSDVRERNRIRTEWVGALRRLVDQIGDWLREADPEGLLDVVPYEDQRGESRLGIYDAPSLRIRLNTDEVHVRPVGLFAIGPLTAEIREALDGIAVADGTVAGRVDIISQDAQRRYMLFRIVNNGSELWFGVSDRTELKPLDRVHLEAILQDLWS